MKKIYLAAVAGTFIYLRIVCINMFNTQVIFFNKVDRCLLFLYEEFKEDLTTFNLFHSNSLCYEY